MIRKASAQWNGSGKKGKGQLSTESKTLKETSYSFSARFENGEGTNPEELIAASHAGCFAMKLSFNLDEAGYEDKELNVECHVSLEDGAVSKSHLVLKAKVDGIETGKFEELVADAEQNCPISKLLDTKISVEHTLFN